MITQDPKAAQPTLAEVVAFLLGEGPLRGVNFGKRAPDATGKWWWRKDLRAALSAPPAPAEPQGQPLLDLLENDFPSSAHGQRITFEGAEYILVAPEQIERLEEIAALAPPPQQPAQEDDARDAVRYEYVLNCEFEAAREYVSTLDSAAYKAKRRAVHDAAMRAKDAAMSAAQGDAAQGGGI